MTSEHAVARLAQAVKDLEIHWRRTRSQWEDAAADAYGKDCLSPIEPAARRAIDAAMRVEAMMHKARRDCS